MLEKSPVGPNICRADSRLAPSQWERSLQSNAVSHWMGANLESALRHNGQNNVQTKATNFDRTILCLWTYQDVFDIGLNDNTYRVSAWNSYHKCVSCFLYFHEIVLESLRNVSETTPSEAELWCFLWSSPEQTVEQTIETQVIWDAMALIMTSL